MKKNDLCICCSGRPFGKCCEPFLKGESKPRSVKQLMRSRYAAYALGGYGDYLIKTWHPASRANVSVADLDGQDYQWKELQILEVVQQGDAGSVEFNATFIDSDGQQKVHHERSAFTRNKGQWYYLDGRAEENE